MEKDYDNEFILSTQDGYIHFKIDEVFDFPGKTSPFGGYDTRSTIEIKSFNYSAKGSFYISTGEIYDFYSQLEKCYQTLTGTATLRSYEDNINIKFAFDDIGHVSVEGYFIENHYLNNKLEFEIKTDQTSIPQVIYGLQDIHSCYGDRHGKLN